MENLKTINILIVENDDLAAYVSKNAIMKNKLEVFKDKKINCVVVKSLAKCFNILGKHKPHLILLDLNLMDSSAKETIEKIKDLRKKINSAILVYSGSASPEMKEQAIKNGATSYLTKPLFSIKKSLPYAIAEAIDLNLDKNSRKKLLNFK